MNKKEMYKFLTVSALTVIVATNVGQVDASSNVEELVADAEKKARSLKQYYNLDPNNPFVITKEFEQSFESARVAYNKAQKVV